MTMRGKKNSVIVRKSSFEMQQPVCWNAVERKVYVTTMANSQTVMQTSLATLEFLQRREASTCKDTGKQDI